MATYLKTPLLMSRRTSLVHNHDRAEVNWQHCTAKVRSIGFFSRHVQDKCTQRVNLTRLLERMKTVHEEDKEELEKALKESTDRIHTMRPPSPEQEEEAIPCPEEPTWKPVSFNHFTSEFMKWTFPSLNSVTSIVAYSGFSQKSIIYTMTYLVQIRMRHLIGICTVCKSICFCLHGWKG